MLSTLLVLGLAPLSCSPTGPVTTAALTAAPTTDAVDELIAEGKRALVARDAAGALEAFEKAHAKSGGEGRTELWLLRGRLAKGDVSAFERVSAIEAGGAKGATLDYVIGAGRFAMGKADEAKGGSKAGQFYDEAAAYLADVTANEPDAFPDAWRMLAEASRWVGRSEAAAGAIDRALEQEKSAQTLVLASKIRVARGAELMGAENTKASGKRYVEQGVADAEAAAAAFGDEPKEARAIGDVQLQRALGLLFLERKKDASSAYAAAMSWDPTMADYGQIMGSLRGEDGDRLFIDTLKAGGKAFAERWGEKQNADAGLHWWLGYAQHYAGDYADSIGSFETTLAKFPAYTNSHWYIGLNHYRTGLEAVPKAAESWKTYAKLDMAGFAATLQSDATGAFGGAIGALWNDSRGGANLETAYELAELVTRVKPNDAFSWNNLGLMGRDAGAWVKAAKPKNPRMSAAQYWEKAWTAYSRAIDMDKRPEYINDGAVLLHYYLEREYDKAIAMYDEAEALAKGWLANRELSESEKGIVEIALRDAGDNRAKLRDKIKRQKGDG